MQVQMQAPRAGVYAPEAPNRTPRERYLWEQITEHQSSIYRRELEWVHDLRADLRD